MMQSARRRISTVSTEEIAKFSRAASEWWNPQGEFGMLHRMNPLRVGYIRDCVSDIKGRNLNGLNMLDIGCGGGLLSEVGILYLLLEY